ncbi:restriction endonuclease [Streptomyces sp. LS1784]|uniref:restriction endonuclease n=1 Tax=Streptomyces sp. LS1784 TaxID=2851533 RepID=UPI001CCBEDFA|nr:restriction endonuclease [Streptomyces sp. LS1784]
MADTPRPDTPPSEAALDADLRKLLPPGQWDDLEEQFDQLKVDSNPWARGTELEKLLVQVLRRAHFRVEHDPATADRQIDLMASSRDGTYLIESKWTNSPSDVDVADNLRVRVKEVGRQAVGVLITVAGVTSPCAARIVRYREEALVVVLDETDIRLVLNNPHELSRLLSFKRMQLEMAGRVHVGADGQHWHRSSTDIDYVLPDSTRQIVDLAGRPLTAVTAAGNHSPDVFTLDLPNVDGRFSWGYGVTLDVSLGARSENELLEALRKLNEHGWLSRHAYWTIQKAGQVWHGVGARTFAAALPQWRDRLSSGSRDSSEIITLFDKIDGGWYTITTGMDCDEARRAEEAVLSFQLEGVPVDQGPLRHLVEQFEVPLRGFYRPLAASAVTHGSSQDRPELEAIGFVTERSGGRLWAVGLVAKNPYYGLAYGKQPPSWPVMQSGVLVCALRSHHPADEPRSRYHLYSWALASAYDSTAVQIVAEW